MSPMRRPDRLRDLQVLAILVPALCAGIYESLRHSLLPSDLPFGLGTIVAVALVLTISYAFAHVSFGIIRRTQTRLVERNRELQELSREVERLAVLEERDRLAREIHDGVAQVLASMLVRLDTIEGLAERGRVDELHQEVVELRRASGEAYADVREAIADLRARPEPGPLGLRQALAEYVSQFGDRASIVATFEAQAPEASSAELPPVAEVQLLRIVQEALANVRKHARASHVVVRYWLEANAWHVSVEDDGLGFDQGTAAASVGAGHLGLQIMRERAESLDGSFEVTSRPGHGTRVHAQVPAGSRAIRRATTNAARRAEAAARGAAAAPVS
jgi:signal transduction histidine kinase